MLRPIQFEGKLILVTGASSGIGRATAKILDGLGARLILAGRRQAALEETAADLHGQQHLLTAFDLRDIEGIPPWLEEHCRLAGGPLSGLVHCAGIGPRVPIRALTRKGMEEVFEIHVYAALALIRAASSRAIVPSEGSSFVLVSSMAAVSASPGLIAYGAAKSALHAIAKTASLELAPKHIRVNCIVPAYVETPMLSAARDNLPGDFASIEKRQVLGWVKPDEIGFAAAYLLSSWASSITGTLLNIDGGFNL